MSPRSLKSAMEHPDNNVYVSTLEMNVSSCRHRVLIKAYTWTHMTGEATLIASYLFGSMGEPYAISLPFPPHTMSVIIVAIFTSHFRSRKYPMQGCCMFLVLNMVTNCLFTY